MTARMEEDIDDRFAGIDIDTLLSRADRRPRSYGRQKCLYEAPEFTVRLMGEETVLEGQSLCLDCKVIGFPAPSLRWFKDDEEILDHPRIHVESDGHGSYSLYINHVNKGDEAAYRCRAENLEGSSSCFFFLSVKGKPKSSRKKRDKNAAKKRSVSFPPMFSTIVEKVEEEDKLGKEQDVQPDSPMTEFYYALTLKGRQTWPSFLGDWAYRHVNVDDDEENDDDRGSLPNGHALDDEDLSGRALMRRNQRRRELNARSAAKRRRMQESEEEQEKSESQNRNEADRWKREEELRKEEEAERERKENEEKEKETRKREEARRQRRLRREQKAQEEHDAKVRQMEEERLEKERLQKEEEERERKRKEEDAMKEEQRKKEEEVRREAERKHEEQETSRREELRQREKEKQMEEERRKEEKRKEELKRAEEEKKLSEEKRKEELKRDEEEKKKSEEKRKEELKRAEEEKKKSEEKRKEELKRAEEEKKLSEEKRKEEERRNEKMKEDKRREEKSKEEEKNKEEARKQEELKRREEIRENAERAKVEEKRRREVEERRLHEEKKKKELEDKRKKDETIKQKEEEKNVSEEERRRKEDKQKNLIQKTMESDERTGDASKSKSLTQKKVLQKFSKFLDEGELKGQGHRTAPGAPGLVHKKESGKILALTEKLKVKTSGCVSKTEGLHQGQTSIANKDDHQKSTKSSVSSKTNTNYGETAQSSIRDNNDFDIPSKKDIAIQEYVHNLSDSCQSQEVANEMDNVHLDEKCVKLENEPERLQENGIRDKAKEEVKQEKTLKIMEKNVHDMNVTEDSEKKDDGYRKQNELKKEEEVKKKMRIRQKEKEEVKFKQQREKEQEELRMKQQKQKEELKQKMDQEEQRLKEKREREQKEDRLRQFKKEKIRQEQLQRQYEEEKRKKKEREEDIRRRKVEEELNRKEKKANDAEEKRLEIARRADLEKDLFEVKIYKRDYSFADLRKSLESYGGGGLLDQEEHKYWDEILEKHNYSMSDLKSVFDLSSKSSDTRGKERQPRSRARRNSIEGDASLDRMKRSGSLSDIRDAYTKSLDRPKKNKSEKKKQQQEQQEDEFMKRSASISDLKQLFAPSAEKTTANSSASLKSSHASKLANEYQASPKLKEKPKAFQPTHFELTKLSVNIAAKRASFHEMISQVQQKNAQDVSKLKERAKKRASVHNFDSYGSREIPIYKRLSNWSDDVDFGRGLVGASATPTPPSSNQSSRPMSPNEEDNDPDRSKSVASPRVRPFVYNSTRTIARKSEEDDEGERSSSDDDEDDGVFENDTDTNYLHGESDVTDSTQYQIPRDKSESNSVRREEAKENSPDKAIDEVENAITTSTDDENSLTNRICLHAPLMDGGGENEAETATAISSPGIFLEYADADENPCSGPDSSSSFDFHREEREATPFFKPLQGVNSNDRPITNDLHPLTPPPTVEFQRELTPFFDPNNTLRPQVWEETSSSESSPDREMDLLDKPRSHFLTVPNKTTLSFEGSVRAPRDSTPTPFQVNDSFSDPKHEGQGGLRPPRESTPFFPKENDEQQNKTEKTDSPDNLARSLQDEHKKNNENDEVGSLVDNKLMTPDTQTKNLPEINDPSNSSTNQNNSIKNTSDERQQPTSLEAKRVAASEARKQLYEKRKLQRSMAGNIENKFPDEAVKITYELNSRYNSMASSDEVGKMSKTSKIPCTTQTSLVGLQSKPTISHNLAGNLTPIDSKLGNNPTNAASKSDQTEATLNLKSGQNPNTLVSKPGQTLTAAVSKSQQSLTTVVSKSGPSGQTPTTVVSKSGQTPTTIVSKSGQSPTTVVSKSVQSPNTLVSKSLQSATTLVSKSVQSHTTVVSKSVQSPTPLVSKSGQSHTTVVSKSEQSPTTLVSKSEQSPTTLVSKSEQFPTIVVSKSGQSPRTVVSKSGQSPTTLVSKSGQSPTTVVSKSGPSPTTVVLKSGQSPTTVVSKSGQSPTTVVSKSGQSPTTVVSKSGQSPTTVVSKSVQSPTTVVSKSGQSPITLVSKSGQTRSTAVLNSEQIPTTALSKSGKTSTTVTVASTSRQSSTTAGFKSAQNPTTLTSKLGQNPTSFASSMHPPQTTRSFTSSHEHTSERATSSAVGKTPTLLYTEPLKVKLPVDTHKLSDRSSLWSLTKTKTTTTTTTTTVKQLSSMPQSMTATLTKSKVMTSVSSSVKRRSISPSPCRTRESSKSPKHVAKSQHCPKKLDSSNIAEAGSSPHLYINTSQGTTTPAVIKTLPSPAIATTVGSTSNAGNPTNIRMGNQKTNASLKPSQSMLPANPMPSPETLIYSSNDTRNPSSSGLQKGFVQLTNTSSHVSVSLAPLSALTTIRNTMPISHRLTDPGRNGKFSEPTKTTREYEKEKREQRAHDTSLWSKFLKAFFNSFVNDVPTQKEELRKPAKRRKSRKSGDSGSGNSKTKSKTRSENVQSDDWTALSPFGQYTLEGCLLLCIMTLVALMAEVRVEVFICYVLAAYYTFFVLRVLKVLD